MPFPWSALRFFQNRGRQADWFYDMSIRYGTVPLAEAEAREMAAFGRASVAQKVVRRSQARRKTATTVANDDDNLADRKPRRDETDPGTFVSAEGADAANTYVRVAWQWTVPRTATNTRSGVVTHLNPRNGGRFARQL